MSLSESLVCSVVVCTRDRPDELDRCLAAISRQDFRNFEVLVVDNAPQKAAEEIAARWGARYLLEPIRGLSRARNSGARNSRGGVVAYLDDDAIPHTAWLGALLRPFADSSIGAVGGAINSVDEHGSASKEGAQSIWDLTQHRVDKSTPRWFAIAALGGLGIGANMAFRKSLFEGWPGFNTRLGRGAPIDGGEEHYAFATLIERGHAVCYVPDAIVDHHSPETDEELRARGLDRVRTVTAYVLTLLADFPKRRIDLITYAIGSRLDIRGVRWRPKPRRNAAPATWNIRSVLRGIALFFRARRSPQQ